jgi:hypothetical protein
MARRHKVNGGDLAAFRMGHRPPHLGFVCSAPAQVEAPTPLDRK